MQIPKFKIKIPHLKLPKLPKWPKIKRVRLFYEVLISFVILIIAIIVLYGVGIYRYHWSRYGVRTMVKVIPYPAGFVGPSVIPYSKFMDQKGYIENFYIKTGAPLPEESELSKQVMDRLIEQKLVERELKRQKFSVSQKEVEEEYKKIIDENQGEENVKKMLDDLYGMKIGQFKKLIYDKLILEKFKNEVMVSVHLEHIVVKDEGRAKDILNQINAGGNFEELAKRFSEDANSKDKGGDLGWVQRGGLISGKEMSKEFEAGAFSVGVGQISPAPVKTEFGFHIFKVTEKKGKIDKSYKDWFSETKSRTRIIKLIGK
jgi:hypothetical protein